MKLLAFALLTTLTIGCDSQTSNTKASLETKTSEEKPEKLKKALEKSKAIKVEAKIVDPDGLKRGSDEQIQLLVQAKSALLNQNWDAADGFFEKIVKTEPLSGEKVTAYIALANSYRDADKPKKAITLLKELDELGTKMAEVQFVLARAYSDMGETTAAIKAYEYTIKIQPEYLQAIVELAGNYLKAGRKEESEKMYYRYEKKIHNYSKILESDAATEPEQLQVLDVFNMLDDDRVNTAIVRGLSSRFPAVREECITLVRDFKLAETKAVLDKLKKMQTNDSDLRVRMMAKDAVQLVTDKK